ELIRARLRDDVDDAARRATELGVVTAGDDLGLLNELVRQVRRDAAEAGVRRVDTFDDVHVLGRAGARERDTELVVLRAGDRPEDTTERATGRDVAGVVVGDGEAGLRRALVDDRDGALDLDDLALLAGTAAGDVDGDVDDGFLTELDQDVG